MCDTYVFIMQIEYVEISCKKDAHICRVNFVRKMECCRQKESN
jgi:hypothetical protein